MTTHPRARRLQAGAFLAVIGVLIAVTPTPALAKAPTDPQAPTVIIDGPTSISLKGGESVALSYTVNNPNFASVGGDSVTTTVTVSIPDLRCENECKVTDAIPPGKSSPKHSINLVAGAVPSGEIRKATVTITAELGGKSNSAQRSVTVRGDDKPPTVKQVGGKLRDSEKKAIAGADVFLNDSANHQYSAKTNSSGSFRFFSSDQKPIAPGVIVIGAAKTGFTTQTAQKAAEAGKSITIDLTLASLTAPSASATPAPTTSASALPTGEVTDDATIDAPAPALTPAAGAAKDDEGSSTLFLVLGGLLVAAGIGAIVLLIMRRRSGAKDKPEPDTDAPTTPRIGGAAVPAPSRYAANDATRIAPAAAAPTRVGTPAVNPAEATMVTTAALPPSLSNAQTLMQQAVVDEYPDPYGAPAVVPHAGYVASAAPAPAPAPAPAAWGAGAAGNGAYGAAVPQARPAPAPAAPAAVPYVQPGGVPYVQPGGYVPADQQQRYDEPTGLWNPQNDAYPGDGGYPQVDEHGQPVDDYQANGHQNGGFDRATGYADQYAPEAGYDQAGYPVQAAPAAVGYDYDAGYAPAGHQAPAGHHAPVAGQQPGGYPVPHQQQAHDAAAPYQAAGDEYAAAGDSYGSWNQAAEGLDHGGAYGGDYHAATTPASYDEPTGYAPRASHQQAADALAGYGRPEGYGNAPAQPVPATPQGRAPQGRPVPVHGHSVQGQPAPGQPMAGQPMQGQPMQGRPTPGRAPQGRPAPGGSLQGGVPPVHGQPAPGRPAPGRPAPSPGGQFGPNGQPGHSAPTHGGPATHGVHAAPAQGYTTPTGVRVEFDQPNDYYGNGGEESAPQVGRHGAPATPAQSTRPGQRRQIDWLDD